jgi:fumarylpyruvate hydrolase
MFRVAKDSPAIDSPVIFTDRKELRRMGFVIPLWVPPSLSVAGTEQRFPVRRIYCVGRNYADHAREMGHDPLREPPFFFSKPADAIVAGGGNVAYPPLTENLHHEIEMVVALHGGGSDIPLESALDAVFGYGVGLDLTRRDIQGRAKEKGHPWDMGKGFDQSAPISELYPVTVAGHPVAGAITLDVNGERRQTGDLAQMSWSVAEVIAQLSTYVRLAPGDLIFSGTPAGVGPVRRGDRLLGRVDGVGELKVDIV